MLFFLDIAAVVVVIIAWFAILFTGRYPRGMFDFVTGVVRWSLRVTACAFLLVTDRYPPFSLAPWRAHGGGCQCPPRRRHRQERRATTTSAAPSS